MLCGIALVVVVFVALSMASPLLLREVIDTALPRHDTRLLIVLCAAMIFSGTLSTGTVIALNKMICRVGQHVVHGLRMDLYDRVQRMPLDFFASQPTAEIQARMASDIGGISDMITLTAASSLIAAVSLLAAGLAMLVLSWPLAAACLILAVVLGLFNRRFDVVRRDLADQQQDRTAALLRLVGDDLSLPGILLGRTFVRHASQRSRFCLTSAQVRDLTYRQRVAGSMARGVIGLTMTCLAPLTYLLAGTAFSRISVGTAIVMVILQLRLTGPIQQLLGLSGEAQKAQALFQRVFDYLDLPPAAGLEVLAAGQPPMPVRPGATLRLQGIWHRYPDSERTALRGIDVDITPGSTTVIMGRTGCGKSTLALVMAGLITPSGGTVRIDISANPEPRPLAPTCQQVWQEVTVVAQETFLFNATIRENLLFAEPGATDRELLRVTDAMQLSDLIAKLPDGLDTMVGERGYQLSGGERQRLALARALLAPASILIADEATSALDNVTSKAVHDMLRALRDQRALIIIAHRIPDLAWNDHVIVLSEGRVAHQGAHNELVRGCPDYRRLLAEQANLQSPQPADIA
jgi:ATP-binding cassette, subfamily B, bacterial